MAESPLGLLSFLSFAFSIIAAVLAIDMYTLLRTGKFGNSWRVMIIASVIFALVQVLRLAEIMHWEAFQVYALTQIVDLVFVMALAYAFFLQRKAFTNADRERKMALQVEEDETASDDELAAEWDEFESSYHDSDAMLTEPDAIEERRTPASTSMSRSHSSLTVPNRPR